MKKPLQGSAHSSPDFSNSLDPDCVEVAIVGGGPAGLTAGLGLVRSHRMTALIDGNRPRHSATLKAHGFLTRDGIAPSELRRIGREDFVKYESATYRQAQVESLRVLSRAEAEAHGFQDGIGFRLTSRGVRDKTRKETVANRVLISTGLREELPAFPSIRVYYGTALHSCVECDGFEKSNEPLALIGETSDIFERALILSRISSDLVVFTNEASTITKDEESHLAALGVLVERRRITDIVGERAEMTGVMLEGGDIIPRVGGFVRPRWHAPVEFLGDHPIGRDDWGLLKVSATGETSSRGLYAASDIVPPGPQQLIIAAGHGAEVAMNINMDLIREHFAH